MLTPPLALSPRPLPTQTRDSRPPAPPSSKTPNPTLGLVRVYLFRTTPQGATPMATTLLPPVLAVWWSRTAAPTCRPMPLCSPPVTIQAPTQGHRVVVRSRDNAGWCRDTERDRRVRQKPHRDGRGEDRHSREVGGGGGPEGTAPPTSVTCALGSPHQPASQQVLQPGLEGGAP